ncbi:MAG: ABC transporter substrate-binding protein, partial [Acidimicrobiia bacterium]
MSIAVALLVSGCASGDDDDDAVDASDETTETTEGDTTDTTAAAEEVTGPAPGVTDDTIKIGVTYVDTASLTAVGLNFNLGDYQATYQALADDINAGGGINGRQLELVFATIDPTGPASADAACVKLTEDDDVFLVTGFFLNDAVLCPVDTHATAVVGGGMTPARLDAAKAPWITWMPDTDQPNQVLDA